MSRAAMVIAGLAIGFVAGRRLLPVLWKFQVRDSRSLRVLVTALTAISLGTAGGVLGTTWDVIPVWVLFVALAGVTTVDLFHYRIPNAIVFPAVLVLLSLMTLISLLRSQPGAIGQAAAAAGKDEYARISSGRTRPLRSKQPAFPGPARTGREGHAGWRLPQLHLVAPVPRIHGPG